MEKLSPSSSSVDHKAWTEAQDLLKQKLIAEDDFSWRLDSKSNSRSMEREEEKEEEREEVLKYVGGVDISYSKENPSMACGILVVLELKTLQVVYQDFCVVTPNVPYVPGFLAFREAPVLLELLEKMKNNNSPFYPQLLMVDGNGILHPRGFGLACHLGILANLPTIGIGKNLHHVDGLTLSGVKQLLEAQEDSAEGFITLKGCSGRTWGAADIRSRDYLRKHQTRTSKD
ncbi:uncharacterized protein [Malus domestica]|uniref:uncharacterized protein isoform X3 n=1 Tax=Malus domestica TaxID=3750 RepID=UPI003974CCB8